MSLPTEEERRGWRLNWLTSIQSIADSETQRRRWLDPAERNPQYSYAECMCAYFDDVLRGEDDAYQKRMQSGYLSEAEAAAVAAFHALAAAHEHPNGRDYDDRAILDDPAWEKVVAAARRAQQHLLALVADPAEREALTQPEAWVEDGGVFRAQRTGATIVLLRK